MALKRAGAELLGTFVLVFGGVGTAVLAGERVGYLGIAFAFGLSLLAMAYAIGPISGCHVNPAVTLGLLVSGKVELGEAVRYWIAQILGAIAAAGVLLAIVSGRKAGYDVRMEGLGANGYGAHSPGGFPVGSALAVEVILTALLVFTVLAATDRIANVAFAGIPIGLVLVLIHLVAIPVTNTSVNPARSIGPRCSSAAGRSRSCGCSSSRRSPAACSARSSIARCSPAPARSPRASRPSRPTRSACARRCADGAAGTVRRSA
jgi:aquaporin Z